MKKRKLSDNPEANFWVECAIHGERRWDTAYQNRWGHWVTSPADGHKDMNWPGSKPPEPGAFPVLIGNIWYWSKKVEEKV